MFTGIIETKGIVKNRGENKISVEAPILKDSKAGDSISINGVCLTITQIKGKIASFDMSGETMKKSNLSKLKIKQQVNIERALKAQDRLGGHFVTGHVDGAGKIIGIKRTKQDIIFEIEIPRALSRYMIQKGSVAVDGISLTIAECRDDKFSVSVIPHTLKMTNLLNREKGDIVNIEIDLIGKYIEKLLSPQKPQSKITHSFLLQHGLLD
jgi:riboflavin synthase